MKAKKTRVHPKDPEIDRFGVLLEESQKFCEAVGLHKKLIFDIAKTDSDWAFILKIDALLETASKEVIRRGLRFKLLNRAIQNDTLGGFVDALPMAGRTSLLVLLDAAGFGPEDVSFIAATRKVRNAYAHNIKLVDVSLIDLIKSRGDKSELIKSLSSIEKYDEKDLMASYEKDGGYLRFLILDATMRVLFLAFHLALK